MFSENDFKYIKNKQDVITILNDPQYDASRKDAGIHLFKVANAYFRNGDISRGKAFFYGAFNYIRNDQVTKTIANEVEKRERNY